MPCHFSRSSVVLYSILISSLRQQARGVCSFTIYYKASVSSIKNRQLLSDLQPLHNYSKLRVPESRLFLPRWHLYAHHYLLMTTIDPCLCRFTIWTLEMVTKKILMILCEEQITYATRYGQLQPKMCANGKFPPDFRIVKTVEEVEVTDPIALGRILRAYVLPTYLRSLRPTSRDSVSTKTAHQAKLYTLFDFLGAVQVSECEHMKRGALMPY